jgi:hypothetical protein
MPEIDPPVGAKPKRSRPATTVVIIQELAMVKFVRPQNRWLMLQLTQARARISKIV